MHLAHDSIKEAAERIAVSIAADILSAYMPMRDSAGNPDLPTCRNVTTTMCASVYASFASNGRSRPQNAG